MKTKRRRLLEKEASVRLGIMRHIYVILDTSQAMNEQDIKPTRHLCCLKVNSLTKHKEFMINITLF